MYEYTVKRIALLHGREGMSLAEDYEQHIAAYAKQGWRFVQLVVFSELAPNERRIDLLFERKIV